MMPLPSPFDYLDYRRFLGDWFNAKKAANPRYSHRLFARRAGQKSTSLLHSVINGSRNLSPDNLESFIDALALDPDEASFFRSLVALDQAKNEAARNDAWVAISATHRFREARAIDADAFAYLSNWALPAIRELATRPDFRSEARWVAENLRPPIREEDAADGLRILQDLGMLVPDETGHLVPAEASIATPPEVRGLAIHNYHRQMLERAAGSMELFDQSERHLLAVTVGVPRSLVPVLKSESNDFLRRLMHLCDSATEDVDQVVQINLQIFPLSSTREDS